MAKLRKLKALHNFISKVLASYWETAHQTSWNTIWSIALNSHWHDFVSSMVPISQMVNNCIGCWKYWASSSDLQDFTTPFLNFWNVSLFEPLLIDQLCDGLSSNLNVLNAWVLGGRMITKNHDSFNLIVPGSSFLSNLADSSVVIKSC